MTNRTKLTNQHNELVVNLHGENLRTFLGRMAAAYADGASSVVFAVDARRLTYQVDGGNWAELDGPVPQAGLAFGVGDRVSYLNHTGDLGTVDDWVHEPANAANHVPLFHVAWDHVPDGDPRMGQGWFREWELTLAARAEQ